MVTLFSLLHNGSVGTGTLSFKRLMGLGRKDWLFIFGGYGSGGMRRFFSHTVMNAERKSALMRLKYQETFTMFANDALVSGSCSRRRCVWVG